MLSPLLRSALRHGPAVRGGDAVVVSLTEFTARRPRDLAGIVQEGLALRSGWWAMPGAIELTLFVEPRLRQGGSLSVWEHEADLRRFVSLPRHAAIMAAYRDRVTVRAATWTTTNPNLKHAWADRQQRLGTPPQT